MGVSTLVWPPQVDPNTGQLVTVVQGSDADVESCVGSILSTPVGWRLDQPTLGRPEVEWQEGGADPVKIAAVIAAFEPRATPVVVAQVIDSMGNQQVNVDPGAQIG